MVPSLRSVQCTAMPKPDEQVIVTHCIGVDSRLLSPGACMWSWRSLDAQEEFSLEIHEKDVISILLGICIP